MHAATAVRRTAIAYGAFSATIAVIVFLVLALAGLGAVWAILVAVIIAGTLTSLAYLRADALALSALGSRPTAEGEMPNLQNLVSGLVVANGFRMPTLHLVEDAAPNAAAVGRHPKHSALVVTTGLLDGLRRIELEGVIAHELTRIRHRKSLLDASAGLLLGHLPPFVSAPLAQRMLEPSTSVMADLAGVDLTRYPPGLAGALEAMAADGRVVKANPRAYRHLWINAPADALIEPEFSLDTRIDVLHEL